MSPIIIFGQSAISFDYKDRTAVDVIRDLESQHNMVFSYTSDLIKDLNITAKANDLELEPALNALFSDTGLDFQIFDNNYIVLSRKEQELHRLCATIVNSTSEDLAFANMYIPELKIGTNADESGKIDWSVKADAELKVEISYIGYEKVILKLADLKSCPQVILTTQEFSFEEIIVREYVTGGIEQSIDLDHMVLRPDRISVIPGLTDADVLQMVQLLPGVESLDESATDLNIRGGTNDQNLILYDGIPIYNSGHFFGMISGFNPTLVDQTNIYLSGFGSNYGSRLSSVIDIQSKNQINEKIELDAGVNFTHGDLSLNIPLGKKMALIAGARKSYNDLIETPTYQKLSRRVFRDGKIEDAMEEDDDEINFNLNFDFNDYNLKFLLHPGEKDRLSFSFFQIDDNLDFSSSDNIDEFDTQDKLVLSNTGFSAQWNRSWNAKFESHISFSYTSLMNNYRFDARFGDDPFELQNLQINDIVDKTYLINNNWTFNEYLNIDFGYQLADIRVDRKWIFGEDIEDELDSELIRDNNRISSSFISLNASNAKSLKAKLGLRYNYSHATQTDFMEPRALIQFIPFENMQIKASAGLYRQFMNQVIEFNDLGLSQDFWVLADDEESTPISRSESYSLGFLYHPSSFQFEIEAYLKRLDGLTSALSNFQDEDEFEFDQGSGTAAGINILLKKRFANFQSWISYSFSRIDYDFEVNDEIIQFKAPHDRPHSLRIAGQYKYRNWNLSLSWKIASGIIHTPSYGLGVEDDDVFPLFDIDDVNSERLELYHRLDLSMMYSFNIKAYSWRGKLGFSFLNLYNRENILSREYFSIYNELTDSWSLEIREREMLRFTPNIVFRVSFN